MKKYVELFINENMPSIIELDKAPYLYANEVRALIRFEKTKFYDLIKEGLIPKGFKWFYSNKQVWKPSEIELVRRAQVQGQPESFMQELCKQIESRRVFDDPTLNITKQMTESLQAY